MRQTDDRAPPPKVVIAEPHQRPWQAQTQGGKPRSASRARSFELPTATPPSVQASGDGGP